MSSRGFEEPRRCRGLVTFLRTFRSLEIDFTLFASYWHLQGASPSWRMRSLRFSASAQFQQVVRKIKAFSSKPFGVNLIVNKSNPKYKAHLETLLELKVDYIITSLGSPREVIERCKPLGIKALQVAARKAFQSIDRNFERYRVLGHK